MTKKVDNQNREKSKEISESSNEETLQAELQCLQEMNQILRNAIKRHEIDRNND